MSQQERGTESSVVLVKTEVGRRLSTSAKLSGFSIRPHRVRRVPIRKGALTGCRSSLTHKMNRTDVPRDGSAARQGSPIGDSQGDEERSDDLLNTVR